MFYPDESFKEYISWALYVCFWSDFNSSSILQLLFIPIYFFNVANLVFQEYQKYYTLSFILLLP